MKGKQSIVHVINCFSVQSFTNMCATDSIGPSETDVVWCVIYRYGSAFQVKDYYHYYCILLPYHYVPLLISS